MSDEAKDFERMSLWSATLEIFCHQVLFVRKVYPKETFCSTRFLGVQCKANRHPGVVAYISQTIKVIVPALFAGATNEVSLVIFDQANNKQVERHSLCFLQKSPRATDEKEVRDLILSVYTLEGLESPVSNSSINFKIMLHLPNNDQNCNELNRALSEGKWFCPNTGTSRTEEKEKRRPMHHMMNSGCNFYFQTNVAG